MLDWAGHRGGGVRRLFDDNSGRPSGEVIETKLLSRLRDWATGFVNASPQVPRIVLLVGGPGNGKTEAVEATIRQLDLALGCDGRSTAKLARSYHPPEGQAVPRRVSVQAGELAAAPIKLRLDVVQDASVGSVGKSPAILLLEELNTALSDPVGTVYLCCVNRGVLDNALIKPLMRSYKKLPAFAGIIVQAVSLVPNAPSCWPLEDHPGVAVWPMDAESLVERVEPDQEVPVTSVFKRALDPTLWPEAGACSAGFSLPVLQQSQGARGGAARAGCALADATLVRTGRGQALGVPRLVFTDLLPAGRKRNWARARGRRPMRLGGSAR